MRSLTAGRAFDLHPRACWRSTSRGSRRACCSSTSTFTAAEGADRVAEVLAVRDGAGPAGPLDKGPFVGRAALAEEHRRGHARQIVGLEVDWTDVEKLYEARRPAADRAGRHLARRGAGLQGRPQVGRATTTTWSPTLKKLIALATIDAPHFATGTRLQIEITVEAVRHRAGATVVKTPFFNPARKTAKLGSGLEI